MYQGHRFVPQVIVRGRLAAMEGSVNCMRLGGLVILGCLLAGCKRRFHCGFGGRCKKMARHLETG
jgi:hypothetical protein